MTRIEQVEHMGGLQHHFIGRERQAGLDHLAALRFAGIEPREQHSDIRVFEVIGRHLDLVLTIYIAVGDHSGRAVFSPDQIVDTLHALQIHRDPLQTVGDLAGDGAAVQSAHLLKIGELRDLHAV